MIATRARRLAATLFPRSARGWQRAALDGYLAHTAGGAAPAGVRDERSRERAQRHSTPRALVWPGRESGARASSSKGGPRSGYLRVMFTVDDIDETLERLRKRGAQLVGEVVQYEDTYRLCYIRGPEGLLIGLAQELS